MAPAGTGAEKVLHHNTIKLERFPTILFPANQDHSGRLTKCATADNMRVAAASPPAPRRLLGFRPRELRPVARSAMRAQPNSAALKNASVFGAPELQPHASVRRKAPLPASFYTSLFSARSLGARRASKLKPLNHNKNGLQ
jgi:hypothetical protein